MRRNAAREASRVAGLPWRRRSETFIAATEGAIEFMRTTEARLLALLIFGFFCDPGAAGQEAADMHLEDAGFIARVADTPAQIARLRTVPARKFIRRTKAGRAYYMYVDPDTCKCVFLGSEQAMKTYRDMAAARLQQPGNVLEAGVAPERQIIQDINGDAAELITDGDILDYAFGGAAPVR
jgi:hypothetical protein